MARWFGDGYVVDDDPAVVDRALVYRWLRTDAYWWSGGLERSVFDRAVDHSLNLSARTESGTFVGFARLVTDRSTFAYLADVYVAAEHRGRGVGNLLTRTAVSHPAVATCRRMLLVTSDAHGVYARHGFTAITAPERFMERHGPVAKRPVAPDPIAQCPVEPAAD